MSRATILGAGAMGAAFAATMAASGYDVHLWGTPLDDELIAALRRSEPHPRTGAAVPRSVHLHDSDDLDAALAGCEVLVLAVASVGVGPIMELVAGRLGRTPEALLILSKGFAVGPTGLVELLTEAAERILAAHGVAAPVIGVGGPCKANEVAVEHETWAVFAGADQGVTQAFAERLTGRAYRAVSTTDVVGVEVSAALKNLLAVGLGIAEGMASSSGQPWHDLRAAIFTEAVRELVTVVELLGGRIETVLGLAGVGDLDVTSRSGRNRLFGERLGRGETARAALAAMAELGLTVEGPSVAPFIRRLVAERAPGGATVSLPLLDALAGIVARDAVDNDIRTTVVQAVELGLGRMPGRPIAEGAARFQEPPADGGGQQARGPHDTRVLPI